MIILSHRPTPPALTSQEWTAVKELKENKDIVIVRADKGNATVIMDRLSYDRKITDMLQAAETYTQMQTNPLAKTQKNVNVFISNLQKENMVTTGYAYKLKSSDAIIPRLYGLPKMQFRCVPSSHSLDRLHTTYLEKSHELSNISWEKACITFAMQKIL